MDKRMRDTAARRSALLVAVLSLAAACSSGEQQAASPAQANIVQGEQQNAEAAPSDEPTEGESATAEPSEQAPAAELSPSEDVSSAAAEPVEAIDCLGTGDISAADFPGLTVPPSGCSLVGRRVFYKDIGAIVQAPGETVYAEAVYENGALELSVATLPDGSIDVNHGDGLDLSLVNKATAPGSSAAPAACDDRAAGPVGPSESDDHKWSYNPAGASTREPVANWVSPITRAYQHIESGYNDCRLGDDIFVEQTYIGESTARDSLSADGKTCRGKNGNNVVDWGSFERYATLAAMCHYGAFLRPGELSEADVRINVVRGFASSAAECSGGEFDLEAVMTHEAGHVFGLSHVEPEAAHAHLTMSPGINRGCDMSARTLGRGDHNALNLLY